MLRNLYYAGDLQAARQLAELQIHPSAAIYRRGTGAYWIPELEIALDPEHRGLLPGLWQALALKRAGIRFSNDGNEIIAHSARFNVAVENEEELFILREVAAQGTYNVLPSTKNAVVIDIGANVGFVSLHFATQAWVKTVWAYEPVPATYDRALRNLKRNREAADKIKFHNYGISDSDGEMTFEYAAAWRGATGVYGLTPQFRRHHQINGQEISQVSVKVRSASAILRELQNAYPGAEVIVKLDCEGCEYRIISALQHDNLLRCAEIFLIEWHRNGPNELLEALTASGFAALSIMSGELTGMIYAWRKAPQ